MKNIKNYISKYKQYLIDQAKSINTINSYIADIEQFNSEFPYITRENVLKYKKMLGDLSSKSVNRKLSSLKSFNEFLLSKGVVNSIYIIKADFIKLVELGNPTKVSEQQVDNFLDNVENINCMFKTRNIAIINLVANTGIRRDEVTNLLLKNLDLNNKELIVIGKGNKERKVYLTDDVVEILNEYFTDREKSIFKNSEYIFVSERSKKLHKDTINKIFNKYKTDDYKVKPHDLRHHFASEIVEQEILPLPSLQKLLGHSSVATTGWYVHPRQESIKKNINKLQIGKRHKRNIVG